MFVSLGVAGSHVHRAWHGPLPALPQVGMKNSTLSWVPRPSSLDSSPPPLLGVLEILINKREIVCFLFFPLRRDVEETEPRGVSCPTAKIL